MLKKENQVKIIFHIDMNAFFCSVACILNPFLRGKPFAIGRENSYKGVVSTASYEARAYGIHSAMPLSVAYKLKPDLMVVSVDYKYYQYYHNKFVELIKKYTNIIEVASIDEVYADMTEASLSKHPLVIAKEIQARLLKEYNLSCSIGIAPTLFLAKMASDIKKPLGVTVLRKRDIEKILYPLSVKEIYGIGKKTYPKLIENGINTIGDFMNEENFYKIVNLIGENQFYSSYNNLKGLSSNIVNPNRYSESNSISTSMTYDIALISEAEILYELRKMTREIHSKMIHDGYFTKTISIVLRDTDFQTISRQKTLDKYTDDFLIIFETVQELLEENFLDKGYRLIGVGLNNLVDKDHIPKEYNLFNVLSYDQREDIINNLINNFQSKYGEKVLFKKNFTKSQSKAKQKALEKKLI